MNVAAGIGISARCLGWVADFSQVQKVLRTKDFQGISIKSQCLYFLGSLLFLIYFSMIDSPVGIAGSVIDMAASSTIIGTYLKRKHDNKLTESNQFKIPPLEEESLYMTPTLIGQ